MTPSESRQFFGILKRYFSCRKIHLAEKIVLPLLVLLYIVCPVDLIPDAPIIGWLDDIGVGTLFLAYCSWRALPEAADAPDAPQPETTNINRENP